MLRAWLLWLLAAACCALAFAFTHAGAALAALCVPVLAALAGFVVLRCSRLPALSLRLPAGGRKDGMISGEIAASRRAPGRVLCRIEVRNDLTGETTEFFAEERFSFRAEHCGRLTVRIRRAWLLGLPGLFARKIRTDAAAHVTVLPDTFPASVHVTMPEVQSPDSDTSSPDRRGSDLTEPFRLREYAPGDSLRQIHWKLSSKLDRLVIREPGMPAARTLLVFWDRSGDAAARDAQAEAVFSVCQSLSEQGYAYQLGWPEGGTARFAEAGSTEELLRDLPLLLRGGAEPLQETGALRGFGKILYFTASPDPVWRSLTAGAEPVLLTGDHRNAAETIAAEVGIDLYKYECLPEDKLRYIKEYQESGEPVCMIGDGINDAPALKTAQVGIAMGGIGSDIAVEAADIALVHDEIGRLPQLMRLARKMMSTINLNIAFSLGLNFLAIILAITGIMNPVVGALVHNAGSVAVIINSALLLNWQGKRKKPADEEQGNKGTDMHDEVKSHGL